MNCKIVREYSNSELIEAKLLTDAYKDLRNLIIFGIYSEAADIEAEIEEIEAKDRKTNIENLLGIAVFVADKSRFSIMNLLHICICDEEKENEYAKELFAYVKEQFQKISVKIIEFKQILNEEDDSRYNKILPYLGFEKESDYSKVMICQQGSFQGSNLDKVYNLATKNKSEIVMIDDYFDPLLRDFVYENENSKFYIAPSEYKPQYCRFYLEDTKIKVAVIAKKQKNGDYLIDGCYVDKKVNQPHIIPYMISVIGFNNKDEIDTSKKMYINIYNAGMAEALLKFMGEESAKKVELKELLYYKLKF